MLAAAAVAFSLAALQAVIGAAGAALLAWHYWGPRKGEWDIPLRMDKADGKIDNRSHSSMLVIFRVA